MVATAKFVDAAPQLADLSDWLRRAKSEIFSLETLVTPELATRLIELNTDNRPIRFKGLNRTVEAYSKAMARGEWQLNGEPIIISREGILNDGQHRLWAVVESGATVRMMITLGVDRESRHTVDQGAARTPGHILAMFGEKNTNQLAHALQFVWAYDGHRVFSYRPSSEELLSTLDRHPGLRIAVTDVAPLVREFHVSAGYMAAAYYVCGRVDRHAAGLFLEATTTGLGLNDKNSPVVRLRKRFQNHLARLQRDVLPADEQAALFIKAFNLHLRRRSTQNLIWRRGGPTPEDFPVAGS